jgi:hypothetical protein
VGLVVSGRLYIDSTTPGRDTPAKPLSPSPATQFKAPRIPSSPERPSHSAVPFGRDDAVLDRAVVKFGGDLLSVVDLVLET